MVARAEITVKYARSYARASKKERGRLLDEVGAVTGWSRDNARRRLARHGELVRGKARYSAEVRAELEAMSPATSDRHLAPARAKDPLRGISTTSPSHLLRYSITIRKAGDEVENTPGFFQGDTVAHSGPTLKREFCRTVNLTDVNTGWVFTRSIRNDTHGHSPRTDMLPPRHQ